MNETAKTLAYGVLLPGFYGTDVPQWLAEALEDGLAGVILFGSNTPNAQLAAKVVSDLRTHNPQAIVAIDEEGGDVSRLQVAFGSALPGNAVLGAIDQPQLTETIGEALGTYLRLIGIDLNLAPCLDINSDPLNPVIGVRSFGKFPELVARHGVAMINGLHQGGISACGKHFPGHGDVTVDSHLSLPTVSESLETIESRELVPFKAAFANDLDVLMTAHLVVSELGPKPATLNEQVVWLARQNGFEGPIITDALDMGAVSKSPGFKEACVQALLAGADLLCLGTTQNRDDQDLFLSAVEAIENALNSGRLSEDRLRDAAKRNQTWMRRQSQRRAHHQDDPAMQAEQITKQEQLLQELGDRAASILLGNQLQADEQIDVQLSDKQPLVLVDLRTGFNHAAGSISSSFDLALAQNFPKLTVLKASSDKEYSQKISGLQQDIEQLQVVALVRSPDSDQKEAARLEEIKHRFPQTVTIHVGWPKSDGVVANWPRTLYTYGIGAANARAAVAVLKGPKNC